MKDKLLNIKEEAISSVHEAKDLDDLENLRVKYLGKKDS